MENLWIMFGHIKCLKDHTNLACHVYDSTYFKVLTIACYDMQSKDSTTQTFLGENLNLLWQIMVCQTSSQVPTTSRESICFFH